MTAMKPTMKPTRYKVIVSSLFQACRTEMFWYLLTMLLITIGWVLFRAENITTAFRFIGNMFFPFKGWYDASTLQYARNGAVVFILAYIGSFPCFRYLKERMLSSCQGTLLYSIFDCVISISLLFISLLVVINGLYSPFIYFNF